MIRTALLLATLAALFAASAAHAQTAVLDPADAAELAQDLADAQEEQGVCYGWEVSGSVAEAGSSVDGPGSTIQARACEQWIVFQARIDYACDTCEGEDTAVAGIDSSFTGGPTPEDLESLGFKVSDLTGDDDDRTLFNMVAALPLLAAEKGLAEPIAAETPAAAVPAADRPTGTPGSDLLRDRWFVLVLCGFLILAGPAYWLYKRAQLQTLTAED